MASICFISTYFFLYSQLISKIDIFWSNVDDFTLFLMLQNSSDFEICSLMWDSDIMLNNKFLSVYRSSCICRIPTQTYCKILLSLCVAMCMCIPCNIYVALGARGLKVKPITELMKSCHILMLQEAWALPNNVGKLNQYLLI